MTSRLTASWQPVDKALLPSRTDQPLVDLAARVKYRAALLPAGEGAVAVQRLAAEILESLPRKLAIMRDQDPAQPGAAAYDGDRVKGGGGSDRTASIALAGDTRIDEDRVRLNVLLRKAEGSLTNGKVEKARTALNEAAVILGCYGARPAGSVARREAAKLNERHIDPGCESCARLPGHEPGVQRWEPIAPGREATDCGGTLTALMGLCSWCYRWVLDVDRLPTVVELATHHAGDKVRRPA